jgi:NAD(P)H dehydrogenase (quinone)
VSAATSIGLEIARAFTMVATYSRIFLGGRFGPARCHERPWGALFKAQGMRDPVPRIQMLDGFNEG